MLRGEDAFTRDQGNRGAGSARPSARPALLCGRFQSPPRPVAKGAPLRPAAGAGAGAAGCGSERGLGFGLRLRTWGRVATSGRRRSRSAPRCPAPRRRRTGSSARGAGWAEPPRGPEAQAAPLRSRRPAPTPGGYADSRAPPLTTRAPPPRDAPPRSGNSPGWQAASGRGGELGVPAARCHEADAEDGPVPGQGLGAAQRAEAQLLVRPRGRGPSSRGPHGPHPCAGPETYLRPVPPPWDAPPPGAAALGWGRGRLDPSGAAGWRGRGTSSPAFPAPGPGWPSGSQGPTASGRCCHKLRWPLAQVIPELSRTPCTLPGGGVSDTGPKPTLLA